MPMNKEAEKRIAAKLAKTMAMLCVRGTSDCHTGPKPRYPFRSKGETGAITLPRGPSWPTRSRSVPRRSPA